MAKTTIVLNMYGGVVQDAFCSTPDAEVLLVDWDTEDSNPDDPGLVEIIDARESRNRRVYVTELDQYSWQELAGTDVQKALQKAGMLPDLPERGESEVRKYILYDFDAGDLATTNVYDSYPEAADDASELDNVIIMPLVFEKQTAVNSDN